jgi:hypothetical protein
MARRRSGKTGSPEKLAARPSHGNYRFRATEVIRGIRAATTAGVELTSIEIQPETGLVRFNVKPGTPAQQPAS